MGIFDKLLGNKNITEQISKLAGNANIASIIAQLTSNKDTLEMFARENYYFLEDGEDVFIVEKAKN